MIKKVTFKNSVLLENIHYLSSDYKTRNLNRSDHNGIDLLGKNIKTDYVIAIDDGLIVTSKYSNSAGNYVEIKHENNYISRYLHMKDNTIRVKAGDTIIKGQILGYMGNNGDSNGDHLHFAILNSLGIPQDPLPYLQNTLNFRNDYYKDFYKKSSGGA